MNYLKKNKDLGEHLRSILKLQHKKVYSVCRIFANNYKEHQALFAGIISAVTQGILSKKGKEDKDTLFLRACLNMTALHTICLNLKGDQDNTIQFKSSDYQDKMVKFRAATGELSNYDKILLFFQLEKYSSLGIPDLIGFAPVPVKTQMEKERSKINFIPYLKEKLIWS
ncbi:hypothetical protein ACX0G9_06695 [Flavitalea flava]